MVFKILVVSNVLVLLALILSSFAAIVPPMCFRLVSIGNLFLPYFVIFYFLVFVGFLVIRKFKIALFSLFILQFFHVPISSIFGLNLFGYSENNNQNVSIASYNMRYPFSSLMDCENCFSIKQSLLDYIIELNNFDIICLQEVEDIDVDIIQCTLDYAYSHYDQEGDLLSLSKFPIKNKGIFKLSQHRSGSFIFFDFVFNGNDIRVYNSHLSTNRPWLGLLDLDEIEENEKRFFTGTFDILKHYSFYSSVRVKQAKFLNSHLDSCSIPLILCGDMNDVPGSYLYQNLKGELVDTFNKKGKGIGSTYNNLFKLLRLDYIFASQDFVVINHEIDRVNFSDHFLVSSELQLNLSN